MNDEQELDSVASRVSTAIDGLGQIELSGIKLENADPRLLDINSMTLDMHVAMQPAALAYYGQLRRIAMRRLDELKNKRERWQKAKYAETKANCLAGGKATVADIEARLVTDNIEDIKKADEIERHAQEVFDTMDVWYEAWKQKGYSIREHIEMEVNERANTATSLSAEPSDDIIGRHTPQKRADKPLPDVSLKKQMMESAAEKAGK